VIILPMKILPEFLSLHSKPRRPFTAARGLANELDNAFASALPGRCALLTEKMR
jgi:hypothetical protein